MATGEGKKNSRTYANGPEELVNADGARAVVVELAEHLLAAVLADIQSTLHDAFLELFVAQRAAAIVIHPPENPWMKQHQYIRMRCWTSISPP